MSDLSARLDLPLIKPSQAQKHVTHNEALQVLDGLVQAALEETGAQTPPFELVEGELYALGSNPVDDWAGQSGKLALRVAGAWLFMEPQEGWRAWDKAAGQFKVYDGAIWAQILPDLNNLDGVGVGTAFDAVNRLAVASEASLFTDDGAGHQLKVNKAAAGDTASLLFQSGFIGHAEMGLAGDTAFSIKVSDDGATWHDALKADAAAQEVEIDFQVVGDAVQTSPNDTTAGRLLAVGAGGLLAAGPDEPADLEALGVAQFLGGTAGNVANTPPGASNQFQAITASANANNQMIFGYFRGNNAFQGRAMRAGTWDDWETFYTTGNIVGTVSQSGGTPTGAVVERGSNANGGYVRFADGTQICWNPSLAMGPVTTAVGGGYKSDSDTTWTYPAAFAVGEIGGLSGAGQNAGRWLSFKNFTNTSVDVRQNAWASFSGGESADVMAVGRWF